MKKKFGRYIVLFLKEIGETFEVYLKTQYKCLGAYLEPCADLAINSYSTQGRDSSARHTHCNHVFIKLGPVFYLFTFDIPDYTW